MEYTNNFKMKNNHIFIANVYCFGLQKRTYCYKINCSQSDNICSIVRVSFGKKKIIGIILSIQSVEVKNDKIDVNNDNISIKKLKNIDDILYKNLFSEQFFLFLKKMAFYNVIHVERLIDNVVLTAWLNKKRQLKQFKITKKRNVSKMIKLSDEQLKISNEISTEKFNVNVLYGVMGSGKTYIFLDVVRRVLLKNSSSQILIMVPEIALTSNLIDTVYNFCGIKPVIWHSSVSVAKKKIHYENIINGKIRIVISTRSGLLLPYKNLSLIVIDEEHDISYKQDEIPVYNARDMAILRAKYENIPVILSSATPSIETAINVMKKKYFFFKIETQFFNSKPPKIEIINFFKEKDDCCLNNEEKKTDKKKTNYICKKARNSILEALKDGKQSMIFINRRGYSRTLKCTDCGHEITCKNCDNLLSYHKQKEELRCHYCGYTVKNIKNCYKCGSSNLSASYGAGVEQIEEEVHSFCNAKTLIFSSDEVDNENDINVISNNIKNGDVDVIIGTQILTKGHHFPRLTNIVVLDIDRCVLDGDFRVFERMFQLLFQLSGRAGRECKNSTVFIQTINPDNVVLKLLKNHDIKQFYSIEMQKRKKFNLPPYSRFILIILASKKKELVYKTSILALEELKKDLSKNVKIIGPSECSMCFLKQNYHYKLLIETDKNDNSIFLQLNNFYNNFNCPKAVMLKVDVDPYSFL